MSRQGTGDSDHYFHVGDPISISLPEAGTELAATVTKISPDEIWLTLWRPISRPPFKKGEEVRIQYWDEGGLYYSKAKILKVSGSANEPLVISTRGESATWQRRKSYRVRRELPLSFVVIDAAETELIDKSVADCKTQDISVSGLKFETGLPLKIGDKLAVKLDLSSSQRVSAFGWVVRAKQIERKGKCANLIVLEFLQLGVEEQVQILQFVAGFRLRDRGKFPRWEVSIPCTVGWEDWIIKGQIVNLSFGGALIAQASAVPPEGALIVVTFQAEKGKVVMEGKINARAVHTISGEVEEGKVGSFGVKFVEPTEAVRSKLIAVLGTLISPEAG